MGHRTTTLLVVFAQHSANRESEPPENLEKILELASDPRFNDIIFVREPNEDYVPKGMDPEPAPSKNGETDVYLGGSSITLVGGNLERLQNTFESLLANLIRKERRRRVHLNLPLRGIYLEDAGNRITAESRYAELKNESDDPVRNLFANFIEHAEHAYPNYALRIAYDGNIPYHQEPKKTDREIMLHIDTGENVK